MDRTAGRIRISVRSLVEFLLRSGSLDLQRGVLSEEAMLEGARIHRRLQKSEGSGYRAEVPLKLQVRPDPGADDLLLCLEGRADGIFRGDERTGKKAGKTAGKPTEEAAGKEAGEPAEEAAGKPAEAGKEAGEPAEEAAGKTAEAGKETGEPAEEAAGKEAGTGEPAEEAAGKGSGEIWIIDEIKTVFGGLREMREPAEVHLAQARCYAYMYAKEQGLDRIGTRMTYCSQVTGEVRYFFEKLETGELERWFMELVRRYVPWARLRLEFSASCRETIRQMVFPFPYREGQYALAAGVYRTIVHGKKLFLQAPTGTGKTLAVLFPALKSIGEGKADRIWYLTAKAMTTRAPLEALSLLRKRGLRILSVVLASKERVCACEAVDCRAAACPRADGHFDRVNAALRELLEEAGDGAPLDQERIAACARRHCVCPYELAMDAADFADVILGDYNYVFHPQARLSRLLDGGRPVLLIDEAHNLLERGREMYSARLSYQEVRRFRRSVKALYPRLWKKCGELSSALRALEKAAGQIPSSVRGIHVLHEWEPHREKLVRAQETVRKEIRWILEQESRSRELYSPGGAERGEDKNAESADLGSVREFLFMLTRFQNALECPEDGYIVFTTGKGSGTKRVDADGRGEDPLSRAQGFGLHLFCADPSARLRSCLQKTVSSVFFSATFLPIQYYKGLLGGTAEDFEMYARSSFSPGQLRTVIAADVTSRYRQRGEESFRRIADRIVRIISCRPGNYMVFFPSYLFLDKVLEAFCGLCGKEAAGSIGFSESPETPEKSIGFSEFPESPEKLIGFSESPESPDESIGFSESPKSPEGKKEAFREYLFSGAPYSTRPIRVIAQRSGMEDSVRAAFLETFEETEADRHLAGFCVLGGMFGEGIDLRDDRLIGSIIVGTGIPPVEAERELLREYFSAHGKNGYDFAYRFPGMNKVLQAAGRVIRTATDAGIVALLDDRFAEPANRALFPVEWGCPAALDGSEAVRQIRFFWEQIEQMEQIRRAEQAERVEKAEQEEMAEKAEQEEMVEKVKQEEMVEKVEQVEKIEQVEQVGHVEQTGRIKQSESPGGPLGMR